MEQSQVRKIQIITAIAIVLLVVLIFFMVTLAVQKVQLDKLVAKYNEAIKSADNNLTDIEKQIAERQTLSWIERLARELGMISGDETLWDNK